MEIETDTRLGDKPFTLGLWVGRKPLIERLMPQTYQPNQTPRIILSFAEMSVVWPKSVFLRKNGPSRLLDENKNVKGSSRYAKKMQLVGTASISVPPQALRVLSQQTDLWILWVAPYIRLHVIDEDFTGSPNIYDLYR